MITNAEDSYVSYLECLSVHEGINPTVVRETLQQMGYSPERIASMLGERNGTPNTSGSSSSSSSLFLYGRTKTPLPSPKLRLSAEAAAAAAKAASSASSHSGPRRQDTSSSSTGATSAIASSLVRANQSAIASGSAASTNTSDKQPRPDCRSADPDAATRTQSEDPAAFPPPPPPPVLQDSLFRGDAAKARLYDSQLRAVQQILAEWRAESTTTTSGGSNTATTTATTQETTTTTATTNTTSFQSSCSDAAPPQRRPSAAAESWERRASRYTSAPADPVAASQASSPAHIRVLPSPPRAGDAGERIYYYADKVHDGYCPQQRWDGDYASHARLHARLHADPTDFSQRYYRYDDGEATEDSSCSGGSVSECLRSVSVDTTTESSPRSSASHRRHKHADGWDDSRHATGLSDSSDSPYQHRTATAAAVRRNGSPAWEHAEGRRPYYPHSARVVGAASHSRRAAAAPEPFCRTPKSQRSGTLSSCRSPPQLQPQVRVHRPPPVPPQHPPLRPRTHAPALRGTPISREPVDRSVAGQRERLAAARTQRTARAAPGPHGVSMRPPVSASAAAPSLYLGSTLPRRHRADRVQLALTYERAWRSDAARLRRSQNAAVWRTRAALAVADDTLDYY